jgi:voltage-gated potassium channel
MLKISGRHVLSAVGLLGVVVVLGGIAIWLTGEGAYSVWESIYFALITVSTVGYAEVPRLDAHVGGRIVASALIICGVASIAFFQSTLTALLIQGLIGKALRRSRMERAIGRLSGHVVLAGCGRTGRTIVDELTATRHPFVVIDLEEHILEQTAREVPSLLYVVGDATHDSVLRAAGIERASSIIAALSDDRDNLFVTLSVHTLNPEARIVAKVIEGENEAKMLRAGASAAVSPLRIGALRLVSEVVRPKVTVFLDQMLRATEKNLRFEEVELPPTSHFVGKSLREVPIRVETKLLVVAVHETDGTFTYNPAPEYRLSHGTRLIVMGEAEGVRKLRQLVLQR